MPANELKDVLKKLPKVDKFIADSRVIALTERVDKHIIVKLIQEMLTNKRAELKLAFKSGKPAKIPVALKALIGELERRVESLLSDRLIRVVNATGTILHTNLGRAPMSKRTLKRAAGVSTHYSNLEFDLAGGKRGLRYDHFQDIIKLITGAEGALAVNNNAAAVLLVLNTFCEAKEAIVSRGELIEIGGSFRIPEVMQKSQSILREVGATNKTHLSDYKRAVKKNTGLLLKVHTSNYRIVGFTKEVGLKELVKLGKECRLPVFNDLGSGCLVDLSPLGIEREETVQDVVKAGCDIVTFSGDKLLGGPQAGVIVGKKKYIDKIKLNPLTRALRLDKMTIHALCETFRSYLCLKEAMKSTPVLKMITTKKSVLKRRSSALHDELTRLKMPGLKVGMKEDCSCIGGGALPMSELTTYVVTLKSKKVSTSNIAKRLRGFRVPVIVRVQNDLAMIDVRTLLPGDEKDIVRAVKELF